MLSRVSLIISLLLAGELVANGTSLTKRVTRLFNLVMVGGSLSLATVAQAEPANAIWRNVRADDVDYRRSVFHLRTMYRGVDYVLHLVYLGGNKDGHKVFVGILPQTLRADEPMGREVRQVAEYSLYAGEGLITEQLELEGEDFYPVRDSGEIAAVDVVIGMFGELDMSSYRPVELARFPDNGEELEMLNYHPDQEPHVLRWQTCQAGRYDSRLQLAQHTCQLPWRPQNQVISSLGAPIFNAFGQLVGFTTLQSDAHQQHVWPTDYSVIFDKRMLRHIPVPKELAPDSLKLSTTWAELKRTNE